LRKENQELGALAKLREDDLRQIQESTQEKDKANKERRDNL